MKEVYQSNVKMSLPSLLSWGAAGIIKFGKSGKLQFSCCWENFQLSLEQQLSRLGFQSTPLPAGSCSIIQNVVTANLTSLVKVVNPRAIIAGRQEMIVYYYPGGAGSTGLYSSLFVLRGMGNIFYWPKIKKNRLGYFAFSGSFQSRK